MAPNGHPSSGHRDVRENQIASPQNWLEKFGPREYQSWQNGNPTEQLSYDDWKTSRHVNGLSLYYATLQIFEESDSSEDDAHLIEVKPHSRNVRGHSAREPKKKMKTNGRATESATPSAPVNVEDISTSGKRRRKARKKYLSEEIVASDGDSEVEEGGTSLSFTETASSTTPVKSVHGRHRKSSGRKPRKTPLSEEIISPEDEMDDPMEIDRVVTSAVASPLPVRSAPGISALSRSVESPKKTILKLNARRTPKKKVLSEETVIDEDTDDADSSTHALPVTMTVAAKSTVNATVDFTDVRADASADPDNNSETASPDPANASAASSRRGLRTRRPAQQRPYYHDAQLFDDVEPDPQAEGAVIQSSAMGSRRVSVISIAKGVDEDLLQGLDDETIALLQEDPDPEPSERKPKHFKGKGRAWKKEESDEDEDFIIAKKKAAKAAKAKAKGQVPGQKKRGRPRKSALSEDFIRDDSDSDTTGKGNTLSRKASPTATSPQTAPKRVKAKQRKSVLSEEIVRDDSESALEDEQEHHKIEDARLATTTAAAATSPKMRSPSRKSDQSTISKSPLQLAGEDEEIPLSKSHTPEGTPDSPGPIVQARKSLY